MNNSKYLTDAAMLHRRNVFRISNTAGEGFGVAVETNTPVLWDNAE
jgi:hypothetical protein